METRCFSPTLSLTPALAHDRAQTLGHALDERVCVGSTGGGHELVVGGVGPAEAEVVADGAVEKKTLLRDQTHRRAELIARDFLQRPFVDLDLARVELVKTGSGG